MNYKIGDRFVYNGNDFFYWDNGRIQEVIDIYTDDRDNIRIKSIFLDNKSNNEFTINSLYWSEVKFIYDDITEYENGIPVEWED